eukprot:CAMPEP_0174730378 /NCGR_PEP_ID=MMETSP1094-20130205/55474_1 /TAXON_ID=156173 /ORGANISM="Chrysochromulina brevifilum, Strain UTEX LB 985" /LENGTH=44 /DNA_ID= /DNA_START= /DNA_END= /DNA_ORIENTATION=
MTVRLGVHSVSVESQIAVLCVALSTAAAADASSSAAMPDQGRSA